MNYRTWETTTNPYLLARTVAGAGKSPDRRVVLFAAGACRASGVAAGAPPEVRDAIAAVEEAADVSPPDPKQRRALIRRHGKAVNRFRKPEGAGLLWLPWYALNMPGDVASVIGNWSCGQSGKARDETHAAICRLMRCLFGNPYRPAQLDPSWRTANVRDLARTVYEDRAFDRLPILADALMDAGCEDAGILGHCRNDGPHARGCWVVDLVLGKA